MKDDQPEIVMGLLDTKTRNKLPDSAFAQPEQRKYPIENKAHAANAKARATQQVNNGNLSPAAGAKIKAAANKVLAKGKKK